MSFQERKEASWISLKLIKMWTAQGLITINSHLYRGSVFNIIIHWTHYLFFDWPKAFSKLSKSAPVTSSSCRLYNNHIMSRTLKVTGTDHAMYDRSAWFLRVIMSCSRVLCCLSEKTHLDLDHSGYYKKKTHPIIV